MIPASVSLSVTIDCIWLSNIALRTYTTETEKQQLKYHWCKLISKDGDENWSWFCRSTGTKNLIFIA